MNILAINTAFKKANLALSVDNYILNSSLDSNCKHSENIMVEIDKLLSQMNTKVKDIDVIACVTGPGSFTGLRIGVAIAKGFMFVNNSIKGVSISSLEFIAKQYFFNNSSKKECFCVMNGLSGNYFIAKYNQDLKEIITPQLVDEQTYQEMKQGENIVCCDEDCDALNLSGVCLSSQVLLDVAKIHIDNGDFVLENDLVPNYFRLSQAEAELKKKEEKND